MNSIRARLLVFILLAFTVVWITAALFAYEEARHEVAELFDAEMAQSAQVLLTVTLHEVEEKDTNTVALKHQTGGHPYVTKIAFQVWTDNILLFHSDAAPLTKFTHQQGYSNQVINGQHWRVFVLSGDDEAYSVQVGQHHEVRDELVREIAMSQSLPMLLALPLLTWLFWLGTGRGLTPLKRVAADVAKRSAHDLSPLPDHGVPTEIEPLTRELNTLLQQLRNTFDRERRFTSDAAHELRTPLASIKTQAQVAGRTDVDTERQQALKHIDAGVNRATHLVGQLLTLAQLDPATAVQKFKTVNLCHVVEGVIADLALAAHAKEIDIGISECQAENFNGNADMLAILVRNLLDNAIRYTPVGGVVDAAVTQDDRGVLLTVTDTGPGVSAAERPRILERFYRGTTENQASGCGLGLSIVKRIAELHDANLMLDQPENGQGLRVSIVFPRSQS